VAALLPASGNGNVAVARTLLEAKAEVNAFARVPCLTASSNGVSLFQRDLCGQGREKCSGILV
jgi:hypothetical protein